MHPFDKLPDALPGLELLLDKLPDALPGLELSSVKLSGRPVITRTSSSAERMTSKLIVSGWQYPCCQIVRCIWISNYYLRQ